jgi:hypothetical protein
MDFGKIITLFFLGALVVLVVTHAPGFSQSAGTLFSGVEGMGTILTGANVGNSVYSKTVHKG